MPWKHILIAFCMAFAVSVGFALLGYPIGPGRFTFFWAMSMIIVVVVASTIDLFKKSEKEGN